MRFGGGQRGASVGAGAQLVASTACLGVLCIPWVQTGSIRRSAFRVVGALRGAGLMSRAPAQAFFVVIALVPGLVGAVWVLWAAGLRRTSGLAAAAAGALTLSGALVVGETARHRATAGLTLAALVGAVALGLGLIALTRPPPPRPRPAPSRKAVA